MPLKLVTNSIKFQEESLWILADQASCLAKRRQFLEENHLLIGDKFITFPELIQRIANTTLPVISNQAQVLFIYQLLPSCQLAYFKSTHLGLAKQAAQTITLLKHNLLFVEQIKKTIGQRHFSRELDFVKIYEQYERKKKSRGFLDEGDLFQLSLNKIKTKQATYLQSVKQIIFDKFHYFSAGQIEFLNALSQDPNQNIIVSFPNPDNFNLNCKPYLEKTWLNLKTVAQEISETGHKVSPPEPKVFLLRSPAQETQFIIEQINALLKEKVSPASIGLCFRKTSHQAIDLLERLAKTGLAKSSFRLNRPLAAPFAHQLFSEEIYNALPESAKPSEFCAQFLIILKKMYQKDISKYTTEDRYWTRSIINLNKTETILHNLGAQADYLNVPNISKNIFLRLLEDELNNPPSFSQELSKITSLNLFFFENTAPQNIDVLIIPQMQEKQYPRQSNDNVFFNYEYLAVYPKIQSAFLSSVEKLGQEHFLFQRLLQNTKTKIILSYCQESMPSFFLEQFQKPEPVIIKTSNNLLQNNPELENNLDHISKVELERDFGLMEHPQYHGLIVDAKLRQMIKQRFISEPLSPSQIEKYAQCPFRFYLEKVLKLKPDQEITPEIQAKDLGSIIHAALERFYSNNLDLFKTIIADSGKLNLLKPTLAKIVDDLFHKYQDLIAYSAAGLRDLEKKKVYLLAEQVIKMEIELCRLLASPVLPLKSEWNFDLKLDITQQEPALIQGRIDRIDTTADNKCFLVLDYKSGKTSSVLNSIKQGLHFQLPMYVQAVRSLLLPDSVPLGAMLVSVKTAEKKHGFLKKQFQHIHYDVGRARSLLDDEQWEDLIENSLKAAATLIEKIRDADFRVKPNNCPTYCDYENICRYNAKNTDTSSEESN
ncbi:MAG: PD-(D/E)XK nuclease family protein [Pseudomonadota bacterium]